jgi:ABC-type nitrate/sulfonate/bicarbonate transport system substrate-binding protein
MTQPIKCSRRQFTAGLAAAGGALALGAGKAIAQEKTIKVGWVKALAWMPWATTTEAVPGVKVELIPFGSSNEELLALASGSIDMVPVGYNNVAALLGAGDVKARFVAGITAYGSVFLARKGANIKNWSDLKGKSIATVRGSTQYVNLVTALAVNKLDVNNPNDINFRSIQNFNDLNIALQRGDVDAIVTFPPLTEQAIQAGFAERVPAVQKTLYDGSFFVASGILASDRIIKEDPATVQAIINTYVAQIDKYQKDTAAWIRKFQSMTGTVIDPALFKQAFDEREIVAYPALDEKQISKVATTLFNLKVIPSNTAPQLLQRLDYTFLAKATGKTPQQLGKGA